MDHYYLVNLTTAAILDGPIGMPGVAPDGCAWLRAHRMCPPIPAGHIARDAWNVVADLPNERVVATQVVEAMSLAEAQAARKEAVTAKRYEVETGGILLGGAIIRTDRKSQALINGAKALAEAEPEEAVDFKAATGWVSLDSATMIAIGRAVGRHVRACFRRERELHELIDGISPATTETPVAEVLAIDIDSDWPS